MFVQFVGGPSKIKRGRVVMHFLICDKSLPMIIRLGMWIRSDLGEFDGICIQEIRDPGIYKKQIDVDNQMAFVEIFEAQAAEG